MSERTDLVLNETVAQLNKIVNALSPQGDSSGSLPEYQYYGLFSVGTHEITDPEQGTGTGVDCTTDKVLLGFNVYSSDEWNTTLEPTILKQSHCYEINFVKIPANKDLDWDNEEIESEGDYPRLGSIWGWSDIKMHTSWVFGLQNNEIGLQENMGPYGDSGYPTYPEFEQLTREQAAAIYESM